VFSKIVIFIFSVIGFFTLMFAAIPPLFFAASYESSMGYDSEIAEVFALANVTTYATLGGDNMTYDYTSLDDAPNPPDWELPTSGEYFEVWWGQYLTYPIHLECRHTRQVFWWWEHHEFNYYDADHNPITDFFITGDTLLNEWDSSINASYLELECGHVVANILYSYNQSVHSDIKDAFDSGDIDALGYYISYEPDWNATSISALTVLGQLMTFQSPNLGFSGLLNTIMNGVIAIPIYVMTAIAIIKLVQSVIPFLTGVKE